MQTTANNYEFKIAELEEYHRKEVPSMACTLSSLVDLRDSYTGGHSNRVANIAAVPL